MKSLFSWAAESGEDLSRLEIAGAARQASASSAQTEQSAGFKLLLVLS